jgi:hypothetical protein
MRGQWLPGNVRTAREELLAVIDNCEMILDRLRGALTSGSRHPAAVRWATGTMRHVRTQLCEMVDALEASAYAEDRRR